MLLQIIWRGQLTGYKALDAIAGLEGAHGTPTYNEVLLRRYSENGVPKRPDYIICENGVISEESLRHAKYYGIPILNINTKAYSDKAKRRGEELLASISESDDYLTLDKKLAQIMTYYKGADYHDLWSYGRRTDIPEFSHHPTHTQLELR